MVAREELVFLVRNPGLALVNATRYPRGRDGCWEKDSNEGKDRACQVSVENEHSHCFLLPFQGGRDWKNPSSSVLSTRGPVVTMFSTKRMIRTAQKDQTSSPTLYLLADKSFSVEP